MGKRKRRNPRKYKGHTMSDAQLLQSAQLGLSKAPANLVGRQIPAGPWTVRIINDPADPCWVPETHPNVLREADQYLREHGPFDDVWGLDCGCLLECVKDVPRGDA